MGKETFMRCRKIAFLPALLFCALLFSSCVFIGTDLPWREGIPAFSDSMPSEEPSSLTDFQEESAASASEPISSEPVSLENSSETEALESEEGSLSVSSSTQQVPDREPTGLNHFYQRLLNANQLSQVLTQKSNLLLCIRSEDKDFSWYYTMEDGSLSIDVSKKHLQSGETLLYNVRGNGYYSLVNGLPNFLFLTENETDKIAALFGCEVFYSDSSPVTLTHVDNETVACKTVVTNSGVVQELRITYFADPETLLLKSVLTEWLDDENTLKTETVEFYYGVESFERDTSAYDVHVSAVDRIKLYLKTDTDIKTFMLASDTLIGASLDAEGREYALYKNDRKTKDVSDLSLQTSGEMMVYLGPWYGDVSFEYTLCEADMTEFSELLESLKTAAIENGDVDAAAVAYDKVNLMYEYIETQANVAYVNYRKNGQSVTYTEQHQRASAAYAEAYTDLRNAIAEIVASDAPFKEQLLLDWSEEELLADHSQIGELQNANDLLLMEYSALDEAATDWNSQVNALYEELVQNSNRIAALQGYENYYEYASQYVYGRDYSKDERDAFRAYVKQYIVPLYFAVSDAAFEVLLLPTEQNEMLEALLDDEISELEKTYLQSYFSEFEVPLKNKMSSMLEKNTVCHGNDEGGYAGAFTLYFPMYEEPVVYFGPGFSNLLTFVHENGHYAAFYGIGDEPLPDLDLCETHSQGNEWLFLSYVREKLDPDVYEAFMLTRLLSGLQGIIISTIVDECEEAIYTAETPYSRTEYDALIESIAAEYGDFGIYYDVNEYFKSVAIVSQVYYISYATSEMASVLLYTRAEEDFDSAALVFSQLLDGASSADSFLSALNACSFPSPFLEETFRDFSELINRLLSLEEVPAAA